MEALYAKFKTAESKSLLKKYLTDDLYNQLKGLKTSYGGGLTHCITPGLVNHDSSIGMYACDPEGYEVFSPLMNKIIVGYHLKNDSITQPSHPAANFGDLNNLPFSNLDPENKFIISTRVRVGRTLEGFAFPPLLTEQNRLDMESQAKKVFSKLTGTHAGTYYSLGSMSKKDEQQLIQDHFLFQNDNKFLRAACGYNHWPTGRGIFHNDSKTFLVWVNEEDHLRIISMQKGGDLAEVYKRLVEGINKFGENGVKFAHSDKLGYLTYCPTNLGTTLRASVHIKIPYLSSRPDFKEICEKLMVQPRGVDGEHTESKGGVYDISNKRRLGISEIDVLCEMANGVKKLIQMESAKSVDV